jgi:pilus assembly protein Flp/PilA
VGKAAKPRQLAAPRSKLKPVESTMDAHLTRLVSLIFPSISYRFTPSDRSKKGPPMKKFIALQRKASKKGQSLTEYGLILALIAVVCITALTTLGSDVSAKLGEISKSISSAGGGS